MGEKKDVHKKRSNKHKIHTREAFWLPCFTCCVTFLMNFCCLLPFLFLSPNVLSYDKQKCHRLVKKGKIIWNNLGKAHHVLIFVMHHDKYFETGKKDKPNLNPSPFLNPWSNSSIFFWFAKSDNGIPNLLK